MTEIDGSVPRGQADGGFLSVRTIDGWLEVDAAAEARPGLARALGIDGIAAPEDPAADLAQVQEAIEQVTARWHAADVLLALEQDGVHAHRSDAQGEIGRAHV